MTLPSKLIHTVTLLLTLCEPAMGDQSNEVKTLKDTETPVDDDLSQTQRYALNYTKDINLIRKVEMASRSSDTTFLLIQHTLIAVESSWIPDAYNVEGKAVGLMQVTGLAVQDAATHCGIPVPPRSDLYIPEINSLIGSCYLHLLLTHYDGDWYTTLVAYHGGYSTANRFKEGKRIGPLTANYVLRIMYLLRTNLNKGRK